MRLPPRRKTSRGPRKRPLWLAGLLAAVLAVLAQGQGRDEPRPPDAAKAPPVEPERLEYPDLEADAAFAGTWQLVAKSSDRGGTKVGDRLVVEERVLEWGPDAGATTWDWHQPGPLPEIWTQWNQYVTWGPTRTPARPWPIIELKRGPSMRMSHVKAIYHLRGDLLWLAFPDPGGRLPADFATGGGRDVEVWRRVAPPVVRLEPESKLDGRWRLASVEFRASGSYGPAANTKVPEHLTGAEGPSWFLNGKEGAIFEVEGGAWREEGRATGKDSVPLWTASRVLRLPRRVYIRRTPEPRPPGVPAEEVGTYRVGVARLVVRFPQQWLAKHADGVIYFDAGERIETYERLGARPKQAD